MNKCQCKEGKLDDLTTYLQTYLNLPFGVLRNSKEVLEVQATKRDSSQKDIDEKEMGGRMLTIFADQLKSKTRYIS